jgi:hypothetical protein
MWSPWQPQFLLQGGTPQQKINVSASTSLGNRSKISSLPMIRWLLPLSMPHRLRTQLKGMKKRFTTLSLRLPDDHLTEVGVAVL